MKHMLENWFDDLGDGLESIGITGSTRSGDLHSNQYLELFKYLSNRRDYRQSTFLQAAACAEENINSLL